MKDSGTVESSNGSSLDGIMAGISELDTDATDFRVDLELVDKSETPIDYSLSRVLVPTGDSTNFRLKDANRQLVKMGEYEILRKDDLQKKRIVHPDMDDYSIMNSFREIRTRLLQMSDGKNFSVMVVSLGSNMGASFASVNLGAAFAYEGEKTALLLDCNQQGSKLADLLNSKSTLGISDYVVNSDIDLEDIIRPVGINRMRLIPYGTVKDSRLEFLSSERMREFVSTVKRRYLDRYIIINAPPLEVSADAAILSEIADYILVVVPYGRITKSRLNKAIRSIPRKKIAGVVLNNCKLYV